MSSCEPRALGFPHNDLGGHSLVIAAGGLAVGVQQWVSTNDGDWGRVLVRTASAQKYRLVDAPSDRCSDVSLVGSEGPWLFFVRMREQPGSALGFIPASIIRVDVRSLRVDHFSAGDVDGGRRFIASLHGSSEDGDSVYARCGPNRPGMPYVLAQVHLSTAAVRPIMELPAMFV